MVPSKKHLLAATMVMAAGVLGVVAPAYADPTAPASSPATATTSAEVQVQIVAKQHELTQVNEEYLDAKLELEKQTAAAEQASANLAAAQTELTTAKDQVADMGVQAYINGQMPTSALLIAGESPKDFIDKANSQAHLNTYNDQRLAALATAQEQTATLKAQVDEAYAAADAAAKTISEKKAYIEGQLPALEAQLAALTEQERVALEAAQNAAHAAAAEESASSSSSSASSSSSSSSATSAAAPATQAAAPVAAVQGGSAAAQTVVNWAMSQRGKPYIWGASGPNGYDCSGLTLAAYRQVGISLPHSSSAQRGYGTSVSLSALQPGDLVFAPGHVAIYIGNGTVVHAPTFGSPVRTMPMQYMSFNAARRLV